MKPKERILVVDDEKIMRDLFVRILRAEECDVVTAESGKEAIKKVKEIPFDIVFLDIRMPGMSGVDVFTEIKRISPNSKVFMMTAFEVPQQIEKALAGGANGSLFKPFHISEIEDIVKTRRASLSKLPVRINGEMLLLDADEIFFIKAIDNGAEIHTHRNTYWARFTLKELEDRLGRDKFFRTHRSYIVNLDKVRKVAPVTSASVALILGDEMQSQVLASRRKAQEVKRRLGI